MSFLEVLMNYTLLARDMENEELLSKLKRTHSRERTFQCYSLAIIAEVERRLLYAEKGFPSLFQYLVTEFSYSEASCLKRIQVARLSRHFPEVLNYLKEGKVSLTVLMKIAPHLKVSNRDTLLPQCLGKSVREVERMVAGLAPQAPKPDRVKPLNKTQVSIYFSADKEFEELLKKAKAFLSHKYPEGRLKDIFTEGLKALLNEKPMKRKVHLPQKMESNSRYIPQAIKDTVWQRDGGACSFVSKEGKRCRSIHFLEWDHEMPFSLGGRSDDPNNIRLLCRSHNRLVASQVFGINHIEKKIQEHYKDSYEAGLWRNRFMGDLWAAGNIASYKKSDERFA